MLGPWELPTPVVCMRLARHPKKSTSAEEYLQYFLEHKHKADVEIYTDGSKSSAGVGAGVAILSNDARDHILGRRLHESASIHTAELYAIKLALQSLKTCRRITCSLYTDSRSAVQSIKNISYCRLVRDILELIVILKRVEVEVVFCWLPGHAGIDGNELADKEAKSAISRSVSAGEVEA